MAEKGADTPRHREIFLCFIPEDRDLADRFEKALKKYKPLPQQQSFSVFKEEHDLMNSEYYEVISKHFDNAEKLILITSEDSRSDDNLEEKADRFAAARGPEHLITVSAGKSGNPGASGIAGGPLICFTDFDVDKDSPIDERHARAWSQLLAILQDTDAELIANHESLKRRRRQLFNRSAAILGSLILLTSVAMIWWNSGHNEREQKRRAIIQQIERQWQAADDAIRENRQLLGAHLAARALIDAPDQRFLKKMFIQLSSMHPRTRLLHIFLHDGEVSGGRFSHDEVIIATWGADKQIRMWDAVSGKPFGKPLAHRAGVLGALFNGDNRRLLSWGEDNTARVWDVENQIQILRNLRHKDVVTGAAFSNDEQLILTWGNDGAARIWDARNGQMKSEVFHHDGWVNGAVLNERNTWLLTWSSDSTARIWQVDSGEPIGPPLRHKAGVNGGCFFDRDQRVLTWSDDGTVRHWISGNGRSANRSLRHDKAIIGVTLDQGEERLLTWSQDGSARLWDIAGARELIPPLRHNGWVFGATLNANESQILTWSFDNTMRLWETNTGSPLGESMTHSSGPRGNDAGIFGAVLSNTERLILSWGDDNAARLWDARSQTLYGLPMQHHNSDSLNREVSGALFNRSGARVLTWGNDGTARFWQVLPIDAVAGTHVFEFPPKDLPLQFEALTGTRLDSIDKQIQSLSPEEWRERGKIYRQKAKAHLKALKDSGKSLWGVFKDNE